MTSATDLERHFLELVNATRAEYGLDPLQLELNLNESADAHSAWMIEADTFSHTGVNGTSAAERMVDADYDFDGSWRATENLAMVNVVGTDSYLDELDRLHTNLMNSPGHRTNILDADVTSIGIGLSFGPMTYSNGRQYESVLVTQNFARTSGTEDLDLYGDDSADALAGGVGDDHLDGEGGHDTLRAAAGDDTLLGEAGNDLLVGGDGDDSLEGGSGDDDLQGGDGADVLRGGDGVNTMSGGADNDKLYGGSAADEMSGGAGDDRMVGGGGDDEMLGGDGGDTIYSNAGDDTLNGEDGNDWSSGGDGADLLLGRDGNDTMRGGNEGDRFYGGADDDLIAGNMGNDTIYGGSGDDRLFGGGDDDRIIGGSGSDRMGGGAGADVFVFEDVDDSAHGSNRDEITDFQSGVDQIDLSGLGDLTFVTSYSGAGGEVRYNEAVGRLYVDLDGGSSDFSIDFADGTVVTADDLIL